MTTMFETTVHKSAQRRPLGSLLLFGATAALAISASALADDGVAGADFEYRTVIVTDVAPPGVSDGAMFVNFQDERIDASGRAAFYGILDGPGIIPGLNGIGIWTDRSGAPELVIREGMPAAGTEGAQIFGLIFDTDTPPNIGLDDAGRLYFKTLLIGGDVVDEDGDGVFENNMGYYTDRDSKDPVMVARNSDQAPTLPKGLLFETLFGKMFVAPDGRFSIPFVLRGPGTQGIEWVTYLDQGNGLQRLYYTGSLNPPGQTPGPIPGSFIEHAGLAYFGPNSMSFTAFLRLPDGQLILAHLRPTEKGFELKYAQGDPAPGFPGLSLGSFTGNSLRRGGDQHAFSGFVENSLGNVVAEAVFYSDPNDVETLVAAEGNQLPGEPVGVQFDRLVIGNGPIGLADDGQMAFWSSLKPDLGGVTTFSNEALMFVDSSGEMSVIAREGDAMPGAPKDVVIGSDDDFFLLFTRAFGRLAMNRNGQVAFEADLRGPGFDPPLTSGLYLFDPTTKTVHKAVQSGDLFDVSGDGSDLREVVGIGFNLDRIDINNVNSQSLNDDGEMVFSLSFADGSKGVFTAKLLSSSPCSGDLNGDGRVGADDLPILLGAWGPNPGHPADFDADGTVGSADLAVLLGSWGPCP